MGCIELACRVVAIGQSENARRVVDDGSRRRNRIHEPLVVRFTYAVTWTVGRLLRAAATAPGMMPPRRFDPERDGYWDGYDYEIDPSFPELRKKVRLHREGV